VSRIELLGATLKSEFFFSEAYRIAPISVSFGFDSFLMHPDQKKDCLKEWIANREWGEGQIIALGATHTNIPTH
jgi:hypothetical protein